MLDAVIKQRPVGQPGEGIVEGAVTQLFLERLAIVDVAGREHDAADVRVVEQVGGHRGDVAIPPVGVAHAPFGVVWLSGRLPRRRVEEGLHERSVLRMHAIEQLLALHGLPVRAEDRRDGAGERAHGPVAVEDRDEVGGILHDRLQTIAAFLSHSLELEGVLDAPAPFTGEDASRPASGRTATTTAGWARPASAARKPTGARHTSAR